MALNKTLIEDKIEVVGDHKNIQIRTATVIKEGGKELTRSFSRKIIVCVTTVKNADDSFTHTETDVSSESDEVKGIAGVVWTTPVKNAKKAANELALTD
tara:strand:- start:1695 stop:1991 length:297 start_codon:yes stop_codon:yes gene_type:complete